MIFLSAQLLSAFISFAPPGAVGGVTSFVFALKSGHYKNNQYVAKLSIEIIGGASVATFLSQALFVVIAKNDATILLIPFAIGLGWAAIIQKIRKWITSLVGRTLDEHKNQVKK